MKFPVYTRDGALLGHATIEFNNGYTLGGESILLVSSCNDIDGRPFVNPQGDIFQHHPLRELVAGLSTSGPGSYYPYVGDFLAQLEQTLSRWGIEIRSDTTLSGDEGRKTITLGYHGRLLATHVYVSWYRMPSGTWEFTCYLS